MAVYQGPTRPGTDVAVFRATGRSVPSGGARGVQFSQAQQTALASGQISRNPGEHIKAFNTRLESFGKYLKAVERQREITRQVRERQRIKDIADKKFAKEQAQRKSIAQTRQQTIISRVKTQRGSPVRGSPVRGSPVFRVSEIKSAEIGRASCRERV